MLLNNELTDRKGVARGQRLFCAKQIKKDLNNEKKIMLLDEKECIMWYDGEREK